MNFKAERVSHFDGKPTWTGWFQLQGSWEVVCNRHGEMILYASEEAALARAEEAWKEKHR